MASTNARRSFQVPQSCFVSRSSIVPPANALRLVVGLLAVTYVVGALAVARGPGGSWTYAGYSSLSATLAVSAGLRLAHCRPHAVVRPAVRDREPDRTPRRLHVVRTILGRLGGWAIAHSQPRDDPGGVYLRASNAPRSCVSLRPPRINGGAHPRSHRVPGGDALGARPLPSPRSLPRSELLGQLHEQRIPRPRLPADCAQPPGRRPLVRRGCRRCYGCPLHSPTDACDRLCTPAPLAGSAFRRRPRGGHDRTLHRRRGRPAREPSGGSAYSHLPDYVRCGDRVSRSAWRGRSHALTTSGSRSRESLETSPARMQRGPSKLPSAPLSGTPSSASPTGFRPHDATAMPAEGEWTSPRPRQGGH